MVEDSSSTVLKRVALALGIPVSAFAGEIVALSNQEVSVPLIDTLELLEAFAAITDAAQRRACIDHVRRVAISGKSTATGR